MLSMMEKSETIIDDPLGNNQLESRMETPRLIGLLSALLERVAESNNGRKPGARATAFHGVTRPAISIGSYLERIFKYANCSESCFLVAYVYLDRLSQLQPVIGAVDYFNVHRLLITSVLVAAKFMDDLYYNNAYYAKIGGITTAEMNFLEVEFLFGLGFHLNVTPAAFHAYTSSLQCRMLLLQQPSFSTRSFDALISSSDDHFLSSVTPASVRLIHHQSCFASNGGLDRQDDASSSSHQPHQLAL